ncbi:hypothetical protein DH86_00000287 [Scytalidium sp. 3C]|nr:hypothetical protein DH86_00000287 [Scytalidium sp. 3C]
MTTLPLTVSPFVSLPAATTLPYTYKTLPSTLPPSSTGSTTGGQEKPQYVVSAGGHAAHPDEIIESCKALQAYIQKVQDDADRELKAWEDAIAARELAEKRRVAPGWLDSDTHILQPERKTANTTVSDSSSNMESLMDVNMPNAEAMGLKQTPAVNPSSEGEELDRAFGGLALNKT